MNTAATVKSRENAGASRTPDALVLAAWFGLVAGLGEGAGLLGFQHLGWLNWNMAQMSVEQEILWISPLFDLLLLFSLGLVLALAERLLRSFRVVSIAAFLFSLFTFFDWLALTGRIRLFGVTVLAAGLAVAYARWFRKHETGAVRFARRSLPWLGAAALALLLGIEGGQWLTERRATTELPAAPPGSPNVLVLVLDTVRADHLSAYGYGRATSPAIERLAQKGVLFENAFATSSWTLPAHASLLTGRFPHEHGAESGPYDGRFPTLAEEMRRRGFRTGAFSANTVFFSRWMGFGPGFLHFEDVFGSPADMAARTLYGRKFYQFVLERLGYEDIPGRKHARNVNRSLLRWLDANRARPFFCFVNYFDAHDPYLPPEPYRSKFSNRKSPGGALNSFILRLDLERPDQLQGEIDAYDGAIAYLDDEIGRLLAALEERGLAGNTLVAIVSDHGESFGEHGLLLHRNALYLEVVRVPLLIIWPGHLPQGAKVVAPVSIASLPSTILDLLGDAGQTAFPGPSLASLWKEAAPPAAWPYPLAELAQFRFGRVRKNPAYSGAMKSLITPQWQWIRHERLGTSLYDWPHDSREENDLAGTPQGHAVTQSLQKCIEANPALLRQPNCGEQPK